MTAFTRASSQKARTRQLRYSYKSVKTLRNCALSFMGDRAVLHFVTFFASWPPVRYRAAANLARQEGCTGQTGGVLASMISEDDD